MHSGDLNVAQDAVAGGDVEGSLGICGSWEFRAIAPSMEGQHQISEVICILVRLNSCSLNASGLGAPQMSEHSKNPKAKGVM